MRTLKWTLAIVVVCFLAGTLMTASRSQASEDPCNNNCYIIVCGDCCYPPPTQCPPIKLYKAHAWAGVCEGPFDCKYTYIGCSQTGAECGY